MKNEKFKIGDFVKVSGNGLSPLELNAEELIGEHGIVVGHETRIEQEGDWFYEEVIVHLANPPANTRALLGGRMWFKENRLELLARSK